MNTSERSQIPRVLLERRDAIAESWHDAIVHTSFTPLTSTEVRYRLGELTGQAIGLLFSEPFERDKAREVGSALASMHYLSSEALGRTQEVLSLQLVEGLSADEVAAVQPRLMALLREIAVGFFEGARDTILREQEQVKAALLSERRRVEEALRDSETSLAEAQRIAHVGHWEYDWVKNKLHWSDEILRIFGLTKEEFGGTFADYFVRVHPDDLANVERAGAEALEGEPVPLEHRIIQPGGEVRCVQLRVQFVFDDSQAPSEDFADMADGEGADDSRAFLKHMLHTAQQRRGGRPLKVVGTVQDITERKRAEQELEKAYDQLELRVRERTEELARANEELRREIARREQIEQSLRESEERFRLLIQNSSDIITVFDAYGTVLYQSPSIEQVLGYKPEDRVDKNVFDHPLVHPEDLDKKRAFFARARANPGANVGGQFRLQRADGAWRHIEAIGVNLLDDPVVRGIVASYRDVTERKRAEQALREIREAERNRMARDLHDGALQDLTYGLAEVQIARKFSEDPEVDERLERAIDVLRRAGQELRDTVYDLRLGGERNRPFPRLVESLVERNLGMVPGYDLRLEVAEGFPSAPFGRAGVELLRILQEALNNARRHSGTKSVRVSLGVEGDDMVAEVSDAGRGFDLDATAGVGLSSMRERTATLGGKLVVESEPGKGTRVRLRAPMSTLLKGASETGLGAEHYADGSLRSEG